jgi:hypothetical protein
MIIENNMVIENGTGTALPILYVGVTDAAFYGL